MEPRKANCDARAFLAIFFASLAIGAAFLFVCLRMPGPNVGDGFHAVALQLVRDHRFAFYSSVGPTGAKAPLYPMLLAGLYYIFGTSATPVMWAHAFLGALTCSLLFLMGCRMFDRTVGLLAGLMFALYPPRLLWSSVVVSETLLVSLLVSACLALVILFQTTTQRQAIIAGVVLGLTALCNSVILFLPLILLFAVVISERRRRRYLRQALVLVGVMWMVILPWTVRNYLVFHRVVPVNWGVGEIYMKGSAMVDTYMDRPGQPMWVADHAAGDEMVRLLKAHGFGERAPGMRMEIGSGSGDVVSLEEDEFFKRLAWESARQDPIRILRKFGVDLALFWYYSGHMLIYKLLNFPLCALALLGLALGTWRRMETRMIVLICAYFYFAYAVIIAIARYSLQIMPLVILLAAAAIVTLVRRVRLARPAS